MADVSPAIPAGRQVVEGYGGGRFRISGVVYEGSIIVFPDRTAPWPVAGMGDVDVESLSPVTAAEAPPEVLLLGCGARMQPVAAALREALRAHGTVIEPMDTGAACRTYNILLAEERRVAAALIAID